MQTSLIHPVIGRESADSAPRLAELLTLVDDLTTAARAEGRAIAGSTAEDVPPLREACAATDAARRALLELLPTVAYAGVTR